MLWRRTARPLVIPPASPVPDAEWLRQAALQASWQRGRWVARRRLAWRWTLWASTRYLLPALAVSGTALWLWLGVLPGLNLPGSEESDRAQPEASAPAPAMANAAPPTDTTPPDMATESGPVTTEYSPEGEELPWPLTLRLESRWAAAPTSPAQAQAALSTDPDTEPYPSLKSENWLHSKEP